MREGDKMITPGAMTVTELLSFEIANWEQEWNHPDSRPAAPEYDDTFSERLARTAFEEAQRQGLAEGVDSPQSVLDVAWPASVWAAARARTPRLNGY